MVFKKPSLKIHKRLQKEMKEHIWLIMVACGLWNELEVFKAGTLTFYALYFCVVGIFFFFTRVFHVLFCAI